MNAMNSRPTRPAIFIGRPNRVDSARCAALIDEVWNSFHFTNFGPMEARFASAVRDYLGARAAMLYVNGHTALESLIRGLGAPGEIITTPYTFASTLHAIVNQGCTPVFCDIEPGGVNIDPAGVEALITPRTRAILGVHVFGVPCRHDALAEIAHRHGVRLIYDAAHAFGARMADGRHVATLGDASILSFHATKIFHSVEGGAVVLNSDAIDLPALRAHRNFGQTAEGDVLAGGSNGKMSELHAAVGIANLETFAAELAGRQQMAAHYRRRLGDNPRFDQLPEGASRNASYYPVFLKGDIADLAERRQKVQAFLAGRGIVARPYFHPCLSETSGFAVHAAGRRFPHAERLARSSLCLPLYAELDPEEQEHILSSLEAAVA